MFRENVLIALTILITILALSFVILLTVYMQIHQMDARLKRLEETDKGIAVPDKLMPKNTSIDISSLEVAEQTMSRITDKGSQDAVGGRATPTDLDEAKLKRQAQFASVPSPTSSTTSTTTENPNSEGFYMDNGHFPRLSKPPVNSRQIPFNLYMRNGHITLEIPPSINLSTDLDQLKKVLNELNEQRHVKSQRDEVEQHYAQMSRHKHPLKKERQQGIIWFRNPRPTTQVPAKRKPFDDSAIFDIVSADHMRNMGINWMFGKRRKRSVRNQQKLM